MKNLITRTNKLEALLLEKARYKRRPPIKMTAWEVEIYRLFAHLVIKLHLRRSREQEGQTKKVPDSLTAELSPILLPPVLDMVNRLSDKKKERIDSKWVNHEFQEVISKCQELSDPDKGFLLEELQQSLKPYSEGYNQ